MVRQFIERYCAIVSHAVCSRGALFVRQSLGAKIEAVTSCPLGRPIVCDFLLSSTEWRVICLYAPTAGKERCRFFEQLKQNTQCNRFLILTCDFNCVLSARDEASARAYKDASTVALSEIIKDDGLDDVAEHLSGGITTQSTPTFRVPATLV